ncbi:GAF domain-containing protein [bacterium]|nr:GAF domain-containing protein [bacterium]
MTYTPKDLSRRLDEMRSLLEATRDLAGEQDLAHLVNQFSRHAAGAVDAELARIWFTREAYEREWFHLPVAANYVLTKEQSEFLAEVLEGGASVYFSRRSAEAGHRALFDEAALSVRNAIFFPLKDHRGRTIGVLGALNKREGRFTTHDSQLLGQLIAYGGVTLANAAAHQQVLAILKRQGNLLEIGRALSSERDLRSLLKLAARVTTEVMDADRTSVFLIDEAKDELWSIVAEGMAENEIRMPRDVGVAGHVALSGEIANITDAYADPRFNPEIDRRSGYRTKNMLVMPLKGRDGRVLGVLQVLNKRDGPFTFDDEEQLRVIASYTSVAVANALMGRENDRLLHRQRVILEAAQAIGRIMPIAELLTIITKLTSEILDADRSTVFIYDRDAHELWSMVAEGEQEIRFSADKGIAGAVVAAKETLNIPEAYDDERFNKEIDRRTGYRTKSILSRPMFDKEGEVMGIFQVLNKKAPSGRLEDSLPFDSDDEKLLTMLGAQAAVSIENNLLYEQRRRMFDSFIETLSGAIDARDKITSNHVRNVTRYTLGVTREMGFPTEEMEVLRVAALLHDFGKIGIRDRILCKPGRFTPDEFEEMKTHASLTRELLDKIRFERPLRGVPAIAAGHHEKLDGSGYPESLVGEEIPFGARIIAVADIFDALTQKRHYKEPMNTERAFSILREEVERNHLDGRCVESFIAWFTREELEHKESA